MFFFHPCCEFSQALSLASTACSLCRAAASLEPFKVMIYLSSYAQVRQSDEHILLDRASTLKLVEQER